VQPGSKSCQAVLIFRISHATTGISVYSLGTTDEEYERCAERLARPCGDDLRGKGYTQCSIVTADLYASEQTLHDALRRVVPDCWCALMIPRGLKPMYQRIKAGGAGSTFPEQNSRAVLNLPGHFVSRGLSRTRRTEVTPKSAVKQFFARPAEAARDDVPSALLAADDLKCVVKSKPDRAWRLPRRGREASLEHAALPTTSA